MIVSKPHPPRDHAQSLPLLCTFVVLLSLLRLDVPAVRVSSEFTPRWLWIWVALVWIQVPLSVTVVLAGQTEALAELFTILLHLHRIHARTLWSVGYLCFGSAQSLSHNSHVCKTEENKPKDEFRHVLTVGLFTVEGCLLRQVSFDAY